MKKTLSALLLFINITVLAQENDNFSNEQQVIAFDKALNLLGENKTTQTMNLFYLSYSKGQNTEMGRLALKKFDSILLIEKTKLIKEIQGTWTITESDSNWGFKKSTTNIKVDKITIKKDVIEFFKNDILVTKEDIVFTKASYHRVPSFTTFDFSDGQIWSFQLKDNKHSINRNVLHLKNEGYHTKDGNRKEISCGNTEFYYKRIN